MRSTQPTVYFPVGVGIPSPFSSPPAFQAMAQHRSQSISRINARLGWPAQENCSAKNERMRGRLQYVLQFVGGARLRDKSQTVVSRSSHPVAGYG